VKTSGRAEQQPAVLFFVDDWMSDTELRCCSLKARGLWIEMLCIMHKSKRYGHLINETGKIEAKTLARLVAAPYPDVASGLAELKRHGVYSTTPAGVIYCRRMARQEEISRKRAEAGRRGGRAKHSPSKRLPNTLAILGLDWYVNDNDNHDVIDVPREEFIEAVYQAYPRHVGKQAALKKIASAILGGADPADILKAVRTYAAAVAEWPADEKKFIPYPASWFHQGRYDDDPEEWKRNRTEEDGENTYKPLPPYRKSGEDE